MLHSLKLAFGLLSILPVPASATGTLDLRRAVMAYPLVGAALGAILGCSALALGDAEPGLRGALLTALWLLLTGALHFDGFCDVADAAWAPRPEIERRRILKDPRKGAFAIAAGGSLLLLKSAALRSGFSPLLLVFMLSWARVAVVIPMVRLAPYPESLMGAASRPGRLEALIAFLIAALVAGGVFFFGDFSGVALLTIAIGGLLIGMVVSWILARRLGGVGGDVWGATIEVSETGMLILWALMYA